MHCSKCNIDVPSSYLKCPSCGQGFHGTNSSSSFRADAPTASVNASAINQSPPPQPTPTYTTSVSGGMKIGGWLILPAIFLPLGIIARLFSFWDSYKPFLAPGVIEEVFTPGSATYNPLNLPIIGYELLFNIFIFIFAARVCILFYRKSASLPKLYIYLLAFMFFGSLIDLYLVSLLPLVSIDDKDAKETIRAFFSLVIWGLYFYKSERVKNTFVN